MNILTLVFTLILILSAITYTRFEQFRHFIIQRSFYEKHVTEDERVTFNRRERNKYQSNNGSPKRVTLSGILKLGKEGPGVPLKPEDEERIKKEKIILKELIQNLYKDQPFYRTLEEKREGFVNEIVDRLPDRLKAMVEQAEKPDSVIRSEEDLAKVDLGDAELQLAFYLMLKGTDKKAGPEYDKNAFNKLPTGRYYPLLDFIKYADKGEVSIYASPSEVLDVFFNPEDIQIIVASRKEVAKLKNAANRAAKWKEFTDELQNKPLKEGMDWKWLNSDILLIKDKEES